jgi:hypothetical protein
MAGVIKSGCKTNSEESVVHDTKTGGWCVLEPKSDVFPNNHRGFCIL